MHGLGSCRLSYLEWLVVGYTFPIGRRLNSIGRDREIKRESIFETQRYRKDKNMFEKWNYYGKVYYLMHHNTIIGVIALLFMVVYLYGAFKMTKYVFDENIELNEYGKYDRWAMKGFVICYWFGAAAMAYLSYQKIGCKCSASPNVVRYRPVVASN